MTLGAMASVASEQPHYNDFRKHATFVPELADFALTERQLGRMLAEYGLDASAGLGLGDVRILYQQLSKSGHLTYHGAAQLYRILSGRQQRLHERIAAEQAAAKTQLEQRREVEQAFRSQHADTDHPAAPPPAGPHDSTPSRHPAALKLHAEPHPTGLARFLELLKQPSSPSSSSSATATARPMTAPASRSSGMGAAAGSSAQLPGAAAAAAMEGTAIIMTARDPLVILRETFQPPACEFPHIRSKLKGVREMMFTPDVRFCLNALKEAYKDWEMAAEEEKIKESLKRGRSKSPDVVAAPASSSSAAAGQVPAEGNIFLMLCAAGCLISLRDYASARRVLTAAESQFPTALLGVEHPYYYCIFLCQGIVHYYNGQFEDGIAAFEAARDIADLAARSKNDTTASRNAGCCLNNIGVCCHMLGRNSEAVASLREAVKVLRNSSDLHGAAADGAVANLAKAVRISFALPLRNMPGSSSSSSSSSGLQLPAGRATRPASAQARMLSASQPASGSSSGVAGLPATVSAAGGKLQAFLKQSITFSPPAAVTAVPTWATRSDGVEAMRKAVAKAKGKGPDAKKDAKKDGKKTVKKKVQAFQVSYAMPYYDPPTFGVANVSLVAKKKAKKRPVKTS